MRNRQKLQFRSPRMNRRMAHISHKNIYRSLAIVLIVVFCYFSWKESSKGRQQEDIKYQNLILKVKGFKTILAYDIPSWLGIQDGVEVFQDLKCSVNKCRLTSDSTERTSADLVLFHDRYISTKYRRSSHQIYALYYIESPYHTSLVYPPNVINWTVTYRYDSTIPTPYREWVYFNPNITEVAQNRNYATNKTKKVAWFVSNCNDKNGRLDYAHELQKYIQVDIYGRCGSLTCSRDSTQYCYDMIDQDYKFYLAFENSNCKDYITEKLLENALQRNVLPIVMGAKVEEYRKYAPKRSFIHVDEFESPKDLAEYLIELDSDDELYNSYFRWKGTGEVLHRPKLYFCRLCEKLHSNDILVNQKWYEDLNGWWNAPGTCTSGSWRKL